MDQITLQTALDLIAQLAEPDDIQTEQANEFYEGVHTTLSIDQAILPTTHKKEEVRDIILASTSGSTKSKKRFSTNHEEVRYPEWNEARKDHSEGHFMSIINPHSKRFALTREDINEKSHRTGPSTSSSLLVVNCHQSPSPRSPTLYPETTQYSTESSFTTADVQSIAGEGSSSSSSSHDNKYNRHPIPVPGTLLRPLNASSAADAFDNEYSKPHSSTDISLNASAAYTQQDAVNLIKLLGEKDDDELSENDNSPFQFKIDRREDMDRGSSEEKENDTADDLEEIEEKNAAEIKKNQISDLVRMSSSGSLNSEIPVVDSYSQKILDLMTAIGSPEEPEPEVESVSGIPESVLLFAKEETSLRLIRKNSIFALLGRDRDTTSYQNDNPENQ